MGKQFSLLKFLGLRTVADQSSIPFDTETLSTWLSSCSNVDITDTYDVKSRDGYGVVTPQSIGSSHSLFGEHPRFSVYVEGDALTIRRDDGDVQRLRNVTRNLPMSCTLDHELRVFHANGVEIGYITATGEAKPWIAPDSLPSYGGETRTLSPPPSDTHIVSSCGSRMVIGSGRFLFYSEPFDPFRFCLDEGNIPFDSRIRMIRKVRDGHYVGTASGIVFLRGDDISVASFEPVENAPVVQGTDCKVDINITRNGANVYVKGIIVTTERSVIMLTDDGSKIDMTDGVVTFPPGATGLAFVKDGRYTVTINTF